MIKFYNTVGMDISSSIETNVGNGQAGGIIAAGGSGYRGKYQTASGKTYVEYLQYAGPWASHAYAGGTMKSSGCSVTSVAVILSGFGIDKNPEDLRPKTNTGTMININSVLQQNGLKVVRKDKPSASEVLKHLQTGNPVIIRAGGKKSRI